MAKINVQNAEINVVQYNDEDYISLTDMARSQMQEHITQVSDLEFKPFEHTL